MTRNPRKDANVSEKSFGLETVTRRMVQRRAEELATINGGRLYEVTAADFERVRQASTSAADVARPGCGPGVRA